MIRINLLPAGLRKRQSRESSPEAPFILLGALLVLGAAAFWGWVKFIEIPKAREALAAAEKDRDHWQAEAKKVDEIEARIKTFEAKVNGLVALLGKRVKWAHTLNDFCSLLGTDQWPVEHEDLRVSCSKLSIKEEASAGGRTRGRATGVAAGSVNWSMDLGFLLIGEDGTRRGEYIKAFYDGIRQSSFWRDHGFRGDPEEFYGGDDWDLVEDFGVWSCQQALQPIRVHTIQTADQILGVQVEAPATAGGRRGRAAAGGAAPTGGATPAGGGAGAAPAAGEK